MITCNAAAGAKVFPADAICNSLETLYSPYTR